MAIPNQEAEYRANEEQTALRRARLLGMPYVDTTQDSNFEIFPNVMSVAELERYHVIPIEYRKGYIRFGISITTPQSVMTELQQRFSDYRVSFAMISDSGFRMFMQRYNPPKKVEYESIELAATQDKDLIGRISDTINQVRADDIFAYLVQQAYRLNASDIHLESQRDITRVRIRIDGVLHTIANLTKDKYRTLVGSIAVFANISTGTPEPQQGHIAKNFVLADGSAVTVNLRVETVSTVHGMDIVMRIFTMTQDMYNLDKLGLAETERRVIDDIISRPTGLVLAVGPTGSGKTTTLYSILNSLNTDQRKIITLEDPVEYQFPGISQVTVTTQSSTQVKFADHLRAVLRLDPDIVMIGEIRDLDTAKTALQASLTGHLVLATFHASSASAALTRLLDVIDENPLYLSAIRLIMAQRLVRRLDDQTKQPAQLSDYMKQRIQAIVDTFPENARPQLEGATFYQPGVGADNPFGYKGQIAIREQMLMNREMRQVLLDAGLRVQNDQLEDMAQKAGMTTMMQNGLQRVLAGETSVEELFRVLG